MKQLLLEMGRTVRVREDLEVGEAYYNEDYTDYEIFTEDMVQARGKEFLILALDPNGVILDHTECVYSYEMLERWYKYNIGR